MTRLLCSAAKAGRGVSHQTAWIESGEAAEGRDQRRGKDNENRHDPHLETRHRPSCKLLLTCNRQRNGARGEKYGIYKILT